LSKYSNIKWSALIFILSRPKENNNKQKIKEGIKFYFTYKTHADCSGEQNPNWAYVKEFCTLAVVDVEERHQIKSKFPWFPFPRWACHYNIGKLKSCENFVSSVGCEIERERMRTRSQLRATCSWGIFAQ
jgi:hypothetical protein